MRNISLVDLTEQHLILKNKIDQALNKIFSSGTFILGQEVEQFEQEFASYCDVKYCIGVASGSDAILLSLHALGIGSGDEIITVPNTFISTVLPILSLGAKPVFVDIDPKTYQIDPSLLEQAINQKTKAIIPVHLYGIPAQMDLIMKIAKKHGLYILEDACQAHGSMLENKKCGGFGDIAAFSFYPGKNLGAAGDGGGIVTNNKKLAEKIRVMRNIGQAKKYKHDMLGYNSRLDTIQAAILKIKLKNLDQWNAKRRKLANTYNKFLKDLVILPPKLDTGYLENFHLYVIRVSKRNNLLGYLYSKGIKCGIHYPIPLHLQKPLKFLGYKRGDFPIAEKMAKEVLSLPMYPELKKEQIEYICKHIKKYLRVHE